MGRPRKPTKVLELSGAFKKDPQRKRNQEPLPTGEVGGPPDYFNIGERKTWNELAGACFWATDSDRQIMEIACVLLYRFRTETGFAQFNHLLSSLSKLGLSPSDRAKVTVPNREGEKSRWAK